MADLIALHAGTPPWKPSDDATLVATYHRHDIPLVGVIQQHGVEYLFQCIVGEIEDVNLWLYTVVSSAEELLELQAAEGTGFEERLAEVASNRYGMLGLAIDGYGLIEWTVIEHVDDEALARGVEQIIEQFEERLRLMQRSESDVHRLVQPA